MDRVEGTSALKGDRKYTLADWRAWPEGERWELIAGVAYAMSPSPRVRHQEQSFDLGYRLRSFLEGKPCRVFMAPLDVFLEEQSEETVVEPDVLVVCDDARVADEGIHGAPDFVAEVLSDSTAYKDLGVKKDLYERNGVREYWIVQPDTCTVFVYRRAAGGFAPVQEYRRGEPVDSEAFPGFSWVCS